MNQNSNQYNSIEAIQNKIEQSNLEVNFNIQEDDHISSSTQQQIVQQYQNDNQNTKTQYSQSEINKYSQIQNYHECNQAQVFVHLPNGRLVSLDINDKSPYLEQMTEQILQKEGIPSHKYKLFLGPKYINNCTSKQIKKYSNLQLKLNSTNIGKPLLFIWVRHENNKCMVIERRDGFVRDIKIQLEKKYMFSQDFQLFYKNVQLQDDQNLQYYHFNRHSEIELKLKKLIQLHQGSKNRIIIKQLDESQKINDFKLLLTKKFPEIIDHHLIYKTQILDGSKLLGDYKLPHQSIIDLIEKQYLNIIIQTQNQVLPTKIEQYDKIINIKQQLKSLLGIEIDKQHIFFQGEELNNNEQVINSKIEQNCTLYLFTNIKDPYEITIINFIDDYEDFTIEITENEQVFQLKQKIYDKYLIYPSQQNLKYFGKTLKDSKDLSYYNIQNYDFLTLEPVTEF